MRFLCVAATAAYNAGCHAIASLREATRCLDGVFAAYLSTTGPFGGLFLIAPHAPSLTQLGSKSAPAPHIRSAAPLVAKEAFKTIRPSEQFLAIGAQKDNPL